MTIRTRWTYEAPSSHQSIQAVFHGDKVIGTWFCAHRDDGHEIWSWNYTAMPGTLGATPNKIVGIDSGVIVAEYWNMYQGSHTFWRIAEDTGQLLHRLPAGRQNWFQRLWHKWAIWNERGWGEPGAAAMIRDGLVVLSDGRAVDLHTGLTVNENVPIVHSAIRPDLVLLYYHQLPIGDGRMLRLGTREEPEDLEEPQYPDPGEPLKMFLRDAQETVAGSLIQVHPQHSGGRILTVHSGCSPTFWFFSFRVGAETPFPHDPASLSLTSPPEKYWHWRTCQTHPVPTPTMTCKTAQTISCWSASTAKPLRNAS